MLHHEPEWGDLPPRTRAGVEWSPVELQAPLEKRRLTNQLVVVLIVALIVDPQSDGDLAG